MTQLTLTGRLSLHRVRLNAGGYDDTGAYYGVGQPVYICFDVADNLIEFRARDRAAAKAHVRALYPAARFTR